MSATALQSNATWTTRSILAIAVCFAINMIDGMDIILMSYIAPSLQKEWGVGTKAFAMVFSAGLAGMAIGGLLIAPLADRFGRKLLVLVALAVMSVFMIASGYTTSITQLAIARVVVGCGIGTVLACLAAIAAQQAPANYRNFAVGFLQGGYPIGAMISGFVTAWALPKFGWHGILKGAGIVSLAALPLVYWLLPSSHVPPASGNRATFAEVVGGERLHSSLLLWISTICAFMALYFIASWITKLAIEAGLPQTDAIIASSIYNAGAFFGITAMSIAAMRLDIRKLASAFLVAAAVTFLWFGWSRGSLGMTLLAAFAMGVALQGGFNALYPLAARLYPEQVRATGIGWTMGLGRIGAFIGPLIGGWALAMHWPLVVVFGVFCVPLLIAAFTSRLVRIDTQFCE